MNLARLILSAAILLMLLFVPAGADLLVNWQNGFEVEVPSTWLRQEGGADGIKLASEDVTMSVEPYSGITLDQQVQRLHTETKADRYEFKAERSFTINEVPAHEMIFYKHGRYLIYYVLLSGSRGFLWTVRSDSTDSSAFLEGQEIISGFRVMPATQTQPRP